MKISSANAERIDVLLDSMSEALIEIGIDNNIVSANKSIETILGIPVDSLLGQPVTELAKRFESAAYMQGSILDALGRSEGVASGDCLFLHENGKKLYLSWALSPLEFHGAIRGRLLTLMNLTDRQELRMALLHEREDFLAVLNHRLRTPVVATDRIIQLILDGQFGELSKKQEQLLSVLGDNVAEINRLMLMIMDIYRYRSAAMELKFREISITELFSKIVPKVTIARIPISLYIDCPNVLLFCDENQIGCLLTHVIENALKYAKSSVNIYVIEHVEESELEIAVEDDGKGIAAEDIKGLFERFYQVSTSGKYAPVTGAGLCLCSEIAKAHGGKIFCKSVLGTGTRFEILIPMCKDSMGIGGKIS